MDFIVRRCLKETFPVTVEKCQNILVNLCRQSTIVYLITQFEITFKVIQGNKAMLVIQFSEQRTVMFVTDDVKLIYNSIQILNELFVSCEKRSSTDLEEPV